MEGSAHLLVLLLVVSAIFSWKNVAQAASVKASQIASSNGAEINVNDEGFIPEQDSLIGRATATHPCDILNGTYQSWKASAKPVKVAVIGGGVAGLSAVKTLLQNNVANVLLLEADNRLGGRVKTFRQGDILVEEGAEWIHGGSSNPLFVIAKNLTAVAANLLDSAWDWRVRKNTGGAGNTAGYDVVESLIDQAENDGALLPYYDIGYGQFFVDKYPSAYGSGWNDAVGQAWLHLLEKFINGEEGTNDWNDMSGRDADEFVDYGVDHQWKNGYDTLINHLKKSVPDSAIRLSSPVCKVYWNETDGKVLLVTNGGNTSYSVDHVIMTASVGHLKERHQKLFQPSLPSTYVQSLNGIDLGVADKVIIGWSTPWWGNQKPLDLLILWTNFNLPQEMAWLYGVVEVFSVHQEIPVLETIITGNEAKQMENLPEETVKQHILQLLTNTTGIKVPQPSFFKRTQWYTDPWKKGAFSSYITVEGDDAGLRSRDKLAVPVKNSKGKTVILWAGEHTHNTRYGTVDGAMVTGERQATKLLSLMAG